MSEKEKGRASSSDVAKLAGVSQSTVSRVFTNDVPVSEEIRERVLKVATELNYHPSVIARSMIQRSTKIICIINGSFADVFYGRALGYFTAGLQEHGYTTLLLNLTGNDMEETLPIALRYQVDGIITTTANLSSRLVDSCKNLKTPAVLFNRYSLGSSLSSVCLDNGKAGQDVAKYLISKGHRKLAYISGDPSSSTNKDRQKGFITGIENAGLEPFAIITGDYTYESGRAAAQTLCLQDDKPDAVFCANDTIAIGFMETARIDFGLKIPEDISVIGFNNSPFSAWRNYDLTTVEQPIERMVETTINILLDSIHAGNDESVIRLIPGHIVERNTVAVKT